MNVRLKRAKELAGYAVQLTKEEGLPTMVRRGAGFVKRRCFGKRARYLPAKKVLEAQRAEMAGKTAAHVVEAFEHGYLSRWPQPRLMQCDNENTLVGTAVDDLCRRHNGIARVKIASKNPMANGMIERMGHGRQDVTAALLALCAQRFGGK